MDDVRNKLDEQIKADLENLKHLQPGTEEYDKAVEALAKLYAIRNEEDTAKSGKDERIFRYIRIGADIAGIVLPLACYGKWYHEGIEFEKTGTISSHFVRNLVGKFKPTKV